MRPASGAVAVADSGTGAPAGEWSSAAAGWHRSVYSGGPEQERSVAAARVAGAVAAARPERPAAHTADPSWPLLLGVRHHGPGSARAVRAALDRCAPSAVLIEGPPEADALVELAAEDGMRPPVALLAHAADDPGRAAFWPLAGFSPEWVAIRWALARGVPVRFIDLPAANSLALAAVDDRRSADGGEPDNAGRTGDRRAPERAARRGAPGPAVAPGAAAAPDEGRTGLRGDPVAVLALAAGYDDPERWWEDVVEHRGAAGGRITPSGAGRHGDAGADDGIRSARHRDDMPSGESSAGHRSPGSAGGAAPALGRPQRLHPEGGPVRSVMEETSTAEVLAPFLALGEAMTALRGEYGHGGHAQDAVREAHMRLRLRVARREFGDRIAVVCGAWHVPALSERTTQTADRRLLKGLPKVRAELSWVPWTHRRLSRHSGYGAGISSPGWYSHLFHAPDLPLERWLTKVAGLLRAEDFAVSPAHVIEAVRLAESLAVMRGRPLAGLAETMDAIQAVMGDGSGEQLALVRDRLVVGDVLGEVPDTAPAAPLQRDVTRSQRSLRLKPAAAEHEMELDLRKETDAARSRLLHRLRLLGVDWGTPVRSRAGTGTFRETWQLSWEPELSVRVAEAGAWGTTVYSAATAKAEDEAARASALGTVTELAERCLLADLPDALPVVMRALADRAALDTDVGHLAQALPALVRSVRYGDVRGTGTAALSEVAAAVAERVLVGLPPACVGLDADAAAEMRGQLEAVHRAIALLSEATRPSVAASLAAPGTVGSVASAEAVPDTAQKAACSDSAGGGAASEPPRGAHRGGGLRTRWAALLRVLAGRDGVPGLIRGRAARLLTDDGRLPEDEAARLMGLALSPGTEPREAASWIEGFIGGGAGGGMLLVHDERLRGLVDGWLTGVPAEAFADVLPLLRRTFSDYDTAVRRTLGELARRGPAGGSRSDGERSVPAAPGFGPGLDADRAAGVLPTLLLLLGLETAGGERGEENGGRREHGGPAERTDGATCAAREESAEGDAGVV